jgi:transcriptional antiterminator NusG
MTNEEENFNLEEEYQQEPEAEESPLYDEHSEPADLPKAPSSSAAATGETASQKLRRVNEEDDNRAWFVIHCYSGYENKVRYNLEQRIETMGMKDKIFDVVIPTQEEIEVREGKRRSIERHGFPGYVLVNMILTKNPGMSYATRPASPVLLAWATIPRPCALKKSRRSSSAWRPKHRT